MPCPCCYVLLTLDSFLFTTGNAWNMTASECIAFIHQQVTLRCIVWLLSSCRFLLPPPHVVLPFTTGNAWNMTASEYNACIHLQVTLRCSVWLLLSCRFLLPPPHVVHPLTTGNTWNMTTSECNVFIHLQVTLFCSLISIFSFFPLMMFSPSQLGMHGT